MRKRIIEQTVEHDPCRSRIWAESKGRYSVLSHTWLVKLWTVFAVDADDFAFDTECIRDNRMCSFAQFCKERFG